MKFAVHYYKSFRYFNQIDEVLFDYKGTEYITEFIPNFLKQEQRAIINIANLDLEEIFEYLLVLQQKHENYVVQIDYGTQREWTPALEEMKIKYMFINYANSMDQVYAYSQYNITDMYICEALGFRLKDLQYLRKEKNIAFRIYPDIAQSEKYDIPDLAKFFVRPEGLDAYEQYVDTIEIYRCDNKISVVYEIYKQRQWSGYLEDLIIGFSKNFSVDNTLILPTFDSVRINCRKQCLVEGPCHYCYRVLGLSPFLEKNDLHIIRKKEPILSEEEQEKINHYIEDLKGTRDGQEIITDNMLFEH